MGTRLQGNDTLPLKRKKVTCDSPLEMAFNVQARQDLDSEIARMFYSSGLAFSLAKNPYYIRSYTRAANSKHLAAKKRRHSEGLLEPLKTAWKGKGVSIVSDGWTNAQRRPLINFMVASEGGLMFLSMFPHIFWTPCVVHTLNLALKNICAAKNTQANAETYEECSWITEVTGDVMAIKNFIVNHSMRLSMFNANSQLKLLSVAETRFASSIIMLKIFKLIKQGLLNMVVSLNWANYREDDVQKASFVKEKILNDLWWDKIDYIIAFTEPIYEMLRKADTDKPCLHLVYDWWDSMIENVKVVIYRHEGKKEEEVSPFYSIVHNILVDRWAKSNTPLHCLAHSLNPRYYSEEWLKESPNRLPPHRDKEISDERLKCFKKYFPSEVERKEIAMEFAKFSGARQSPEYIKGESSMWDLGADGFDTLDDVGILGMADLSLDELEMEAMLFTADDTIDVDDEDR
ncbi:DUF659 domain-containing protein [Artemisia annua]|uniref:DUF659 domain-containing protein n=1 Tax=Artemisia annua TaxID=35608 RepID=A0A2U1LPT2_ARTAN|nr:DUF659 domain-containing protein [Artemisia annua]